MGEEFKIVTGSFRRSSSTYWSTQVTTPINVAEWPSKTCIGGSRRVQGSPQAQTQGGG